jgi:2-oxoglutarate/2-oxoacid ferredoxin oxidoreductase subunit alpha
MSDMVKGNIAMAEAAVRAGARLYAGYPITPSTEIMEYLSDRMPEVGGVFIQAESEVAGINMVLGGAACGVKSFTASSGPGISLKQEGISSAADEELPIVVITVVRYGNGLGTLSNGQSDYKRETRGGGGGDYRNIVLTPYSVQEAVELVGLAFDLSEKYKMTAVLMTEASLGQMMEPCEYPEFKSAERMPGYFDGKFTNPRPCPLFKDRIQNAADDNAKYAAVKANEQRWEDGYIEDADYVFVAFGLPGRSTMGAVEQLRAEGHKVGFIRPIAVWPYPEKAFEKVKPDVKGFISVEANATGQMVEDIALTLKRANKTTPVYCLPYCFGIPTIKKIKEDFLTIKAGKMKEVF